MLVLKVEYNRNVDTHRLVKCHVNICQKLPQFYEELSALESGFMCADSVESANSQLYLYYKYIESALLACRSVCEDKFLVEDLQYVYDCLMFAEIVVEKEF